jgi:hypothetical protein
MPTDGRSLSTLYPQVFLFGHRTVAVANTFVNVRTAGGPMLQLTPRLVPACLPACNHILCPSLSHTHLTLSLLQPPPPPTHPPQDTTSSRAPPPAIAQRL